MRSAEAAWEESLRSVTVADLAAQVDEASPQALAQVGAWLSGA
jgi:DNA-binding IscR family transcriptional regulator